MPSPPGDRTPDRAAAAALRQVVLAVSVLRGVDVELDPAGEGVVLSGAPPVHVPWEECRRALGAWDAGTPEAVERVTRWLQARRRAADLGGPALTVRLRAAGLPVDHLLHPGTDWVRTRVLGGALHLGPGVLGLDPVAPDDVCVVPQVALVQAGVDVAGAWPCALARLEELGAVAAELHGTDARGRLSPVGGSDVVTLLGAGSLRRALVRDEGGMAAAVVPMLRRGWTRLGIVDPAFGPAAAAATDAADRGFPRPLLLTADEVTVVRPGGRPVQIVLGAQERATR